jgi:excisionase family DNA binding protein
LVDNATIVHKLYKPNEGTYVVMANKVAIVATKLPEQEVIEMSKTEFMNVRDAAARLGVHENTVRNIERRGELKAIRLPGSGFRRFRREDVERMRQEMWSQFAPDTTRPSEPRRPSKRSTLTDEDYAAS